MIALIRKNIHRWKHYKNSLKTKRKAVYHLFDLAEALLVALVAALFIRAVAIQTSLIPTGSMIPTLQIRDRLFVNKLPYYWSSPNRGDIVVFKSPYKDKKEYVKRCIGLPGETVMLEKGIVFINGKQLILPGVLVKRDYSYYGPVEVPDGHYFVLGDNRAHSADSRVWGFVPEDDLVGKAWYTFWPFKHMRILR
ncbi:MAG: signal peptidase I [bacterium]